MHQASVIVPARNAEATLPRTLAALSRQQFDGDYEVIVVDDGSTDRTAEVAQAAPCPVTLIRQSAQGPAVARNVAVERSSGAVLAFCDADVFPTRDWLAAGVRALAGADIVQGRVLPDPSATRGPFDRTIWIDSQVGLWETASLFVSRDLFDRVGGFEQWLQPSRGKALAEDVWFGYRALRLGARPAFCPEALAHHAVFGRRWRSYVTERRRLEYFPAMVSQMPELRRAFLYRRLFLDWRTARLDLAALAAGLAVLSASPAPLPAAVPYFSLLRRRARRAVPEGPRPAVVACADLAADLVGLLSLVAGSIRYRSLVI